MVFDPRITDEMRDRMFANWPKKKLQSMADDEFLTVPELKENLLECAALHDIDTLDSFLVGYGKNRNHVNDVSQLDGTPMECDAFNVEPQTPAMTSPMSQNSDSCQSVFDSRVSSFTTPSSQYTPAKLKIAENGSPIKWGNTRDAQLLYQTDGASSDLVEPRDRYTWAIDANRQPNSRIFDPDNRPKYRSVPRDLLLAFNPDNNVLHLRGVEPSTGNLQVDPHTLVIYIEGVIYDEDGQAGAAVFFHPVSPWNTVTCVKKTRDNAKLEALYIALNMISFTAANDPNLKAVYIMSTGRNFCLASTTGDYSLADRQAVDKWLPGADKTTLAEINDLWTDITKGVNGQRAVDVRLWCVPEETMRPVTEVATAYLYEQKGRDWYAENGKIPERFEVESPNPPAYQKDYAIVAPQHIVDQGPQAVTKWTAEAKARFKQSVLHKHVASDGCRDLNDQLRDSKELMSTERFLEAYAMATKYMSEDPQKHIDQFVAEQRAIRQSRQMQAQWMANGGTGTGYGEGGDTGCEDEKLVQQVLDMDWE
ncbi:hypothetical protein SLS64_002433 [Diaporthe eres]|uniref:Uncharacterized protein n=1 Tax=Diaporthe eres TaxID=83184 RepID=A0ABR1NVG4_DIAER